MADEPTPKQTGIVLAWFVFAAVVLWIARHSADESNQVVKPLPRARAAIVDSPEND